MNKLSLINGLLFASLIMISQTLSATTLYVNKSVTSGNNGTSWATAYQHLQDALNAAVDGDEIWVAAGVYYPDEGAGITADDKTLAFTISNKNIKLYGGFAGGETQLSERNSAANICVLSGDIGQDDTHTANIVSTSSNQSGDNSYHVVYLDGTQATNISSQTVIDGFVITAGSATATTFPDSVGGGLYCNDSGTGNECSPLIVNTLFKGNLAGDGGAIYNNGEQGISSPTLINLVFAGNTAKVYGGAIVNNGQYAGVSSPIIINSELSNNSASQGGAIYNVAYSGVSNPSLINLTFNDNSALHGGAVYSHGLSGSNGTLSISNSILWGNSASIGKQIYNGSTSLNIGNNLIEHGFNAGDFIDSYGNDVTGYTNNVTGNISWSIGEIIGSNNSNVNDGGSNLRTVGINPVFTDVANGDLTLQESSPAIDVGNNSALPTDSNDIDGDTAETLPLALAGNIRIANGTVDLGAFELVININSPVFTSSDTASVEEGNTAVITTTATDADNDSVVSYSLNGGTDNDLFEITSDGILTFKIAPDFKNPTNADTNNTYIVTVQASDGINTTDQTITITITDVDEIVPILAEVTAVTSPSLDRTPNYTFSSSEAGTISYAGDCSSNTTTAISGNNSISFNTLALGTYNNCTITVSDSNGNTSSSLSVTAFTIIDNDQPVNTIPATQTIDEDTSLSFSNSNSNLISIANIEPSQVTVTLTATNGALTLISSTTNLTFNNGDGTDDTSMEFSGTVTDINTALEDMIFTPTSNFNGVASVQIVVNDGTLSDDDTVNITVTAVNDAPSFTKGDDQTVFVNAEQNITAWATNIDFGSANESSQTLNFIVTNDNNSLFSVQPAIDASGNLTFTASAVGSAVVTVILSDGIDTSAAQNFNIKVNELPPPPRPSQPTTQQPPEPTGCTLSSSINCSVKNEGTITDVKIEPEGSIEGGTLEGEIKNEGTLKDITLAEGTKVEGGQIEGKINGNPEAPAILINVKITAKAELSNVILDKTVQLPEDVTLKDVELRGSSVNGGKLEGTIRTTSSATVIKNVFLGENATIIGGKLAGTISGTPNKPAILEHLTIEPKTQLTNVIISDGVEMPADVSLASGVRFSKTENIPENVDLTATLPKKGQSVDLSADPIINGIGLLAKINRLQQIIATSNQIEQNSNTGFLTLKIELIYFAVIPMKVRYVKTKTRASTDTQVKLGVGQRVYFTTLDGMEVTANSAVQDLNLLKTALAKLNLPTFKITEEGNIKIPATETIWFSARPDLASTIVDKNTANGFITKEDGNVALIFEDENGEKREQILYPSPADMSALGKFDLTPKGILEFEIDGQKIKGRLDYKVEQGKATSEAVKVTEIADSNDVMITYPDGTEQRLFGLAE